MGGAVGLAPCHCVAGPGMGGPAGATGALAVVPGIDGALTVGGYAAPCGGVDQLPYAAGWPIMPVAGGGTAVVCGVWQPTAAMRAASARAGPICLKLE